ncbi:MAG: alpha/beta hydrolase, partial [Phycisphaeraceae bacterium]
DHGRAVRRGGRAFGGRGGERDRRQRPNWRIEDDATSENSQMLKRILDRYPDADTNDDGALDATEARAFIDKQRERWRERAERRRPPRPTHNDLPYGPDDKHHLDLYLAESDKPTPLVVFFHGGQFITGDERDTGTLNVRALLEAGISIASVDYRTTDSAPFPAPFDDATLALQYLRFYAETFNIDATRVAAHGEEAGGNLALYLALHDDLADLDVRAKLIAGEIKDPRKQEPRKQEPLESAEESRKNADAQRDATDPEGESEEQEVPVETRAPWKTPAIAAMSTRLVAAVARHPIASFDPRAWTEHEIPMNKHERLMSKYLDVRYLEPLNDPAVIALVEQVSPLALISTGDPELLLMSQYEDSELADDTAWTVMRHHPRQSKLIVDVMRAYENTANVRYRGMQDDPGVSSIDFLVEKLK